MSYQHLSLKSSKAWISVVACGILGITTLPTIAQSQPAQNSAPPTLEGRWRLVDGERPTPPVSSQTPPITAEFSGGRLSGFGGCNQYTTSYQTSGEQLKVGTIASTRKACQEPLMQQEFRYLAALEGAQNYKVNQQGLRITYQTTEGTGVLRFVAEPPPEPSSFIIHW